MRIFNHPHLVRVTFNELGFNWTGIRKLSKSNECIECSLAQRAAHTTEMNVRIMTSLASSAKWNPRKRNVIQFSQLNNCSGWNNEWDFKSATTIYTKLIYVHQIMCCFACSSSPFNKSNDVDFVQMCQINAFNWREK